MWLMKDWITVGKKDSIQYECDDNGILTIQIDTTDDLGPSASGKTIMLASSGGNQKINVGSPANGDAWAYLGLNLYRYPEK